MFHRMTLTAAAALMAGGPAFAGGFAAPVVVAAPTAPVVVAPAPVVVATTDWSGGYVGAQLGFGRLSTDATFLEGDEEIEEEFLEGEGTLFGVHAGYLFDFGRFVAGAELDYDRTQMDFSFVENGEEEEENVGGVDSIARAKLLLGFDAGRVLPYVTAGLARAEMSFEDAEVEAELDDTYNGRFIGIGAKYAVSENFMVGIEALRHNFDDTPAFLEDEGGSDFDSVIDTVSVRASYRF